MGSLGLASRGLQMQQGVSRTVAGQARTVITDLLCTDVKSWDGCSTWRCTNRCSGYVLLGNWRVAVETVANSATSMMEIFHLGTVGKSRLLLFR